MKIIKNEKLIKNRNTIGQTCSLGSLLILGLGLYLSFKDKMIGLALLALIVGFILSQIGIFMGNRWGKSPRPDQVISSALKGFDDRYSLYHYMSGVPHLLVGPSGIWNIITFHQTGTIIFDDKKKRWKQKGGNVYLKLFGQENLGRPDLDVESFTQDLTKYFSKAAPELVDKLQIQSLLLFTSDKATLEVNNAPISAVKPDKLKDFMRRAAKSDPINPDIIVELQAKLPDHDILAKKK